jgi:hypothetical protein
LLFSGASDVLPPASLLVGLSALWVYTLGFQEIPQVIYAVKYALSYSVEGWPPALRAIQAHSGRLPSDVVTCITFTNECWNHIHMLMLTQTSSNYEELGVR